MLGGKDGEGWLATKGSTSKGENLKGRAGGILTKILEENYPILKGN